MSFTKHCTLCLHCWSQAINCNLNSPRKNNERVSLLNALSFKKHYHVPALFINASIPCKSLYTYQMTPFKLILFFPLLISFFFFSYLSFCNIFCWCKPSPLSFFVLHAFENGEHCNSFQHSWYVNPLQQSQH